MIHASIYRYPIYPSQLCQVTSYVHHIGESSYKACGLPCYKTELIKYGDFYLGLENPARLYEDEKVDLFYIGPPTDYGSTRDFIKHYDKLNVKVSLILGNESV